VPRARGDLAGHRTPNIAAGPRTETNAVGLHRRRSPSQVEGLTRLSVSCRDGRCAKGPFDTGRAWCKLGLPSGGGGIFDLSTPGRTVDVKASRQHHGGCGRLAAP
jgi:hypothetical protein